MAYLQYINKNSERFHEYSINKKLYEGKHYEVFNIKQFEYYSEAKIQYIAYNYPEILTNAFNNLIWSEEPTIKFDNPNNQKFFDDYVKDDEFFIKMRQATETSSHSGEAVFQLLIDEDGNGDFGVVLSQVDNSMWFPIFDDKNPSKKAKGHIIYIEKTIEVGQQKELAILLEIHLPGQILWEAYSKKSGSEELTKEPVMAHFKEEMENVLIDPEAFKSDGSFVYNTKCKYPLVFHLPNHKIAGSFFGKSDYTTPVVAKVYATNQNYNQIQYVLRKHAHPKMIVPKDVIKQAIKQVTSNNGEAQNMGLENAENAKKLYAGDKSLFETLIAQKLIDKLEFYGSDINSSDPKYLTWDGNLNESREQIKLLKQALYEETQLAKVLIDPEMGIGSATGIAILRLAQPSLHKAVMKQAYICNVMGKLIYTILNLAKEAGVKDGEKLDPEIPSISFRDGLVNDVKELIDEQVALIDAQLTTRLDAIMRTQNLTQRQAEKKFNEIQNENSLFSADTDLN